MKRQIKRLAVIFVAAVLVLCTSVQLMAAGSNSSAGAEFKNVIFMIGDGMGENHLRLAEQEGYTLFMEENADVRGWSMTRSTSEVTDSAAGATALSAGIRINNNCVGTYYFDASGIFMHPRYITEHAQKKGYKTGIVTTDLTTGATPAGYSVHVKDRSMADDITAQQLESDFDLIWGAAAEHLEKSTVEEYGFKYISTKEEMEGLTSSERSFGQFGGNMWRTQLPEDDASPTLEEMTVKAISLLDDGNDSGFFLMVEGAHIDKHSHKTDNGADYPEKRSDAANAVKGFDNAIKAAVEFARQDGNTLVVVTADHETGALTLIDGEYKYQSGMHSGVNVPVFVYCSSDLIADGEAVDNMKLPMLIGEKLGWSKYEFPRADAGTAFNWLKKLLKSK